MELCDTFPARIKIRRSCDKTVIVYGYPADDEAYNIRRELNVFIGINNC
jgi:hypothetical protein